MECIAALYPLAELPRFQRRYDDDFIDRLSYRYSMFVFLILGLVFSARQQLGEPISCWTPAQFTHEWTEYTNKICWISNTYYVPPDESIPRPHEKKEYLIAYYQWVPILVIVQAVFFFVPSVIWKKLNCQSGIHVNKTVSVLTGAEHGNPEVREKTVRYIVRNLDRALRSQQEYRTGCCIDLKQKLAKNFFLVCGKRYGNYIVTLYLFVKLLYIGNAVGQLFLLNEFLGVSNFFGIEVLDDLVHGRNLTVTVRFPRVTMCDFSIRTLGDRIHDYVVQCALPINLFYERAYIFIWFWLMFLSIASTLNLISWMWTLFSQNRRRYVKKYLKIMHKNFGKTDFKPSKEFCEDYLRQDGIFVLRIIAKNTNDVVVGEIILAMWEHFKKHHQKPAIKPIEDV